MFLQAVLENTLKIGGKNSRISPKKKEFLPNFVNFSCGKFIYYFLMKKIV